VKPEYSFLESGPQGGARKGGRHAHGVSGHGPDVRPSLSQCLAGDTCRVIAGPALHVVARVAVQKEAAKQAARTKEDGGEAA